MAAVPPKELMNVKTQGSLRPKLSLPFRGGNQSRQGFDRCSSTLSASELRRIVAGMVE